MTETAPDAYDRAEEIMTRLFGAGDWPNGLFNSIVAAVEAAEQQATAAAQTRIEELTTERDQLLHHVEWLNKRLKEIEAKIDALRAALAKTVTLTATPAL